MRSKEISKTLAVSALVLLLPVCGFCAESISLTAPDLTPVGIHRDEFGVPHIVAETEVGAFFGQGFAVAQDRLYQAEVNRRAAQGKLAEWFGSSFIASDIGVRRLSHTTQELTQTFNSLPPNLQAMLSSYSDGINAYIDSITANPAVYKPLEFENGGFTMEPWTVEKSLAFLAFFGKRFGGRGGSELDRLAELQALGQVAFDLLRPINDPTSPTTIQGGCAPSSPGWHYSGMSVDPAVVDAISRNNKTVDSLLNSLHVPKKLGSFAALISAAKSSTGEVMLLGCPQSNSTSMNISTPNVWHEIEIFCPTFHTSGMTTAGLPTIMIGRNEQIAWTATSGLSDNIDVYIDSTMDASYSFYWHNSAWTPFDTIVDTIFDNVGGQTIFTHYRTVHGPVFGDDLGNHQVFSQKRSFWDVEWKFLQVFLDLDKSSNIADVNAALAQNPYSFNLFYAGRDQSIKYWHSGLFQDRSDGVDPRLPHKGDGSEEWGGFIPFASLPQEANPVEGFFVNWNNKPVCWWNNGDNVIGETTRLRVNNIFAFVTPLIEGFSYADLKGLPLAISAHGNYQQAIVVPTSGEFVDSNIVPPGQSGFKNIAGMKDAHFADQWTLHLGWDFKDMLFGYTCIDPFDIDNDFVGNSCDNCPADFNPGQEDSDADGIGDVCAGCCDLAGDANNSGSVNIADVTFLIARIFAGGAAPPCCEEGDANGSGGVNIADVTFLIARIFAGGPAPLCGPAGMGC